MSEKVPQRPKGTINYQGKRYTLLDTIDTESKAESFVNKQIKLTGRLMMFLTMKYYAGSDKYKYAIYYRERM